MRKAYSTHGAVNLAVFTIIFGKVTKLYQRGTHPALDDVGTNVERGESVLLVGPLGSGRSTMPSLILAEERPTFDHVYVLGRDLSRISQRRASLLCRQIGAVFQDSRLLGGKSVHGNVMPALQVINAPHHKAETGMPEAIEVVGLEGKEKRYITGLSGGECRRVAIARAMVDRPRVLLVDKPTRDPNLETRMFIMRLFNHVNRSDTAVAMAIRGQSIVNQLCKRVVRLKDGVVVRDEACGVYRGKKR